MQAVILNDTRADYHHGCSRVMAVLEERLERTGISVIATSPTWHAWWHDRKFMAALKRADRIVVNGEGKMHHGKKAAADLLRVATNRYRQGKGLFLVNALYQNNPVEWKNWLSEFDGIWARDSRSAAELGMLLEHPVKYVPDLSLCAGAIPSSAPRCGVIVGDSVDRKITEQLAALATSHDTPLVPAVSALKRPKGRTRAARAVRRGWAAYHAARASKLHPSLRVMPNPEAYAAAISTAKLYITGRFHGVCYALITGTPFLAIQSNSWKIETLIEDCGLSKNRLVRIDEIAKNMNAAELWQYSDPELNNIHKFLAGAEKKCDQIFASIANAEINIGITSYDNR